MRELVLVRHGETVGQSSIRLYGATDLALAEEGEAQASAAGRRLAGSSYDAVFTSPMIRAQRSAQLVLAAIPHPQIQVEVIEGFREVDFGAWEGWTWEEVAARDPSNLARFRSEGLDFRFPQGESRAGFIGRVQTATAPSIEAAFDAGAQRVLSVLHKGVIKAILARLLGTSVTELASMELALGSIHRLWREPRGSWTLRDDPEPRP